MSRTVIAIGSILALAGSAFGQSQNVNGRIGTAGDSWNLLTEAAHAAPITGGSALYSDDRFESSAYNTWDGINNSNVPFADNRGDLINFLVSSTPTHLYVAVAGPTAVFNNWFNQGDSRGNGDVGDLFIAIDTSGGAAAGSLRADRGHKGFGGVKGVDFLGWTPSHVLGVQFVNNGGGGNGLANLELTGNTFNQVASSAQGVNSGGFMWNADINGTAAYDGGGPAGEFEFMIPWSMLGFSSEPVGLDLRFNAYVTHNYAQSDAYDSLPGVGNGSAHEQIGDNPGDPDWIAGSFAPGATDAGSFGQPGADFIGDINFNPGPFDGIDTMEEYLTWRVVPTPGTAALLLLAGIAIVRRGRPE